MRIPNTPILTLRSPLKGGDIAHSDTARRRYRTHHRIAYVDYTILTYISLGLCVIFRTSRQLPGSEDPLQLRLLILAVSWDGNLAGYLGFWG